MQTRTSKTLNHHPRTLCSHFRTCPPFRP